MKANYLVIALGLTCFKVFAQTTVTFNLNDTSNTASQAFSEASTQTLSKTDNNTKKLDYNYCRVNGSSKLTITGKLLSDAGYQNLKGSVKSIEEYSGDAIMDNIEITKTDTRGTITDSNGDSFVGAFTIAGQVQIDTKKHTNEIKIFFDKYGNIEKKKWLKDGEIRAYENIYNSEGQLTAINITGGKKGKTNKYKYDKQGRVSQYHDSKVVYNDNGFVDKYDGHSYIYNSERNFAVLATEKLFDGEKVTKYIYEHNSLIKSINISDIMVSSTGAPIFGMPEESYTYDEKNNVITSIDWLHAYTYDEHGNWIEHFELHEQSNKLIYSKRIIEYNK